MTYSIQNITIDTNKLLKNRKNYMKIIASNNELLE
jgi:hypothetical protein